MKAQLYSFGVVTDTVDCNDIDYIDNPCYFDDVVRAHFRNGETKICDSFVFLTDDE